MKRNPRSMPSAATSRGTWPLVGAVIALAVTGGLIFDGYRGAREAEPQHPEMARERRVAGETGDPRSQSVTPVAAKSRSTPSSANSSTQRTLRTRPEASERPRGNSVAAARKPAARRPAEPAANRWVRPVNDETAPAPAMAPSDESETRLKAAESDADESMGRRFWDDEEVTDEEIEAEQDSFSSDRVRSAPRLAQLPAPPATTTPPAAAPMATAPMATVPMSSTPMSSGPMGEPAAKPSSGGPGTSGSGTSGSSGSGSASSSSTPAPAPAAPRPVSKGRQTLRTAGEKMVGRAKKAIEGGVYAGSEVTFLSPLREPEQIVGIADFTTGQVWQQTGVSGFGSGMRLWAGVMPEDQGFRVRYFAMANDQLKADPVFPQFAQPAFSSASHYDIDALDLEFTQIFPLGHHRIDASFGVRMAELSLQSSTIGYADVGNGVSVYGMAMAANEMRGIGFTGSVGGFIHIQDLLGPKAETRLNAPGPKTPFQEWVMHWGLFYNIRATALWSETAVSVLTDANAVVKGNASAAAFSRNQATAVGDERQITGNFDLQFGFEYEKKLEKLPTSLVMRIGFEYQRWSLGEVSATSRSQAFLSGNETEPFGGGVRALADRNDSYLDLFGIAIAVGLSY